MSVFDLMAKINDPKMMAALEALPQALDRMLDNFKIVAENSVATLEIVRRIEQKIDRADALRDGGYLPPEIAADMIARAGDDPRNSAFQIGYNAGRLGATPEANPFLENDPDAVLWERGLYQARGDMRLDAAPEKSPYSGGLNG